MNNEYLAVVDDRDRVVDKRLRSEIHTQGLRHRAVHILVFNDRGDVFLQKRSMNKELNKGLWDSSAAGHVDYGEDYLASAHRELREELGISVTVGLDGLFKLTATPALGMKFIHVFKCCHAGPFNLAADEVDEGAWISPALVAQRVAIDDPTLTTTFKAIWQHYQHLLS